MRDGLEEAHGEGLGRHVGERSSTQGGERGRGSHGVAPVQDALESSGRADVVLSGSLVAHLAVLALGRFIAVHGTSKLGDRGEAHGRRGFEHVERAPFVLLYRDGR